MRWLQTRLVFVLNNNIPPSLIRERAKIRMVLEIKIIEIGHQVQSSPNIAIHVVYDGTRSITPAEEFPSTDCVDLNGQVGNIEIILDKTDQTLPVLGVPGAVPLHYI
jgi:hypothetical protein